MLILLTILAYSASLIAFQAFFALTETSTQLSFHFITITLTSISYYFILKKKSSQIKLRWVIPIIFIAFIATPNLLQNDQFRYVWDGASSANAINPFQHAPNKHPYFTSTRWAQIINHPDLKTIYPPLSQLIFFISHKLNPVFWFQDFKVVSNLHYVVLGLKIFFGIFTSFFIYFFRDKRWELVVAHPLFLYTVMANNHIDGLLILPLAMILKYLYDKTKDQIVNLSLTAAILIKWFPLIFAPPIIFWNWKKNGLSRSLSQIALGFALILFSTMIFYKGVSQEMFSSLETFGKEWYFNGYFHLIFGDFLGLFIDQGAAYLFSKYVGILFAGLSCLSVIFFLYKEKINTSTAILYILITYFFFTPTLMPWYMLSLLPFLIFFEKTPTVLWLWPILTLSSKAYFYEFRDPMIVRYLAYSLTSYFLISALRKKALRLKQI